MKKIILLFVIVTLLGFISGIVYKTVFAHNDEIKTPNSTGVMKKTVNDIKLEAN